MPSSLTARDINAIADEVGGGDVKGGAKAFGAFMRSMRDKGITLRDVVKSYGITLSSIQRQELAVSTIKKNWPDAPFAEGTKVRPEDAFAQLLGTPEGQKYLDAAESGVFDEQAADAVVQKFRSFGFHNKLKEQMKTAVEQFYPKAKEIIDAVNSMPTDQFIDYVRNNVKGISYGKVGFWSGQLGRGDIPTFDSRQGKLVYGKEVPVTKQVLMDQKDRLTQLGIKVPAAFKDFAQTLLHHEVWDRLNQSDTEHGQIKEAMLRYMPSDTDYLSAVKQGDTKAAQQMVDEAAKAAGAINNARPLYHGGNKTKTSFASGATRSGMGLAYLTDKKQVAWKYALGGGINDEMSLPDYRRQQLKKLPSREPTVQKLYVIGDVADFSSYSERPNAPQLIEMFGEKRMSRILEEYSSQSRDELDRGESVESTLQNALDEGGFVQEDTNATAAVPELQFIASSGLLSEYLKNVKKDVIAYNDDEAGGKTYVVFDPTKIKSADPITKDDAGNVIPLSKRFQKTSDDIRYMPSDGEYLNAVKRGSTKAAQDMVDAAAKAAGYTIGPVYHGTPTGGFNVFDKRMRGETSGVSRQAFSFTTDKKAAEGYSKRLGDEAVRLDAGLRVANDAMRMFDEDIAAQEYFSSKGYSSVDDGMLPEFDWGSIDDVPEFIKELRGYAKDLKPINANLANSFVEAAKVMASTKAVPEVKRVFLRIPENAPVFQATPATLGQVMSGFSAEKQPTKAGIVELPGGDRIYYVADSSQVKLADPVTKDLDGNVIPLSQRFKATSEDIRYMPAEEVQSVVEGVISEANKLGFEVANEQSSAFGSEYVTIRDPESNREWKMRFSDHERQLSSITKHTAPNFEQVGNINLEAAVSWLRKKRETLDNPPKFDQKKYEEELQSKAQSEVRKYEQTVRDLEANRDKRIAQGNDQKAANIQSQIDQIKNSIGYKSALNQVGQPSFMPSPDSAMPGAYSFPGGYRALPGKAKGSLRIYGSAGSLIGIASSLDEAQRILRRKNK